MKNGGWLDNYNDSQASAPEGMEGDGFSNVGRNYSPAWGGQFQNGGKAPKYVESKNDPRYKAYQDSLSLYNYSNRNKKFVGDYLSGNLGEAPSELLHKLDDNTRSSFKDIAYHEQVEKKFNKIKPIHKTNVNASAQGIKNNLIFTVPSWKKPEQPVIVKPTTTKQTTKPSNTGWTPLTKEIAKGRYEGDLKNMVYRKKSDGNYDITYQAPPEVSRQPIQAIQNNLRPAGLVQGDFDIDADAEIQPEVRHAKSWKYNTREGRSEESGYVNSPEDMDYYTRLKDFYQTGAGKGLGNKVEITPQYQMGGSVYPVNYVPQAQEGKELTFLQPTSDKLPEGYRIPYSDPSSERAMSIGGENGEPAYLIPSFKYGKPLADPIDEFKKTKEHLGGPFKTWKDAEKWEKEVRHPAVEKKETIMFPQEEFAMGGSIPGAVGFSYARTQSPAPSNGKYAKKTMASAQNGKEMQYYQNGLDFKPKSISRDGSWLSKYDVAQTGTKKFKLKDERDLAYKPAESTNIKKKNFDLEQDKERKTYLNQLADQQKETSRRKKLTQDQREREDYNVRNEERGSIQAHVPESTWDRTKAIVSNPLTAFGYAARNQSLPTRFQHGERNVLDNAIDWINPLQGVAALSEIPGELGRGEYLNAGLSALDAADLGVYAKGARKALGTKSGLLSNAHKLNPKSYQRNLPENTMWRGLGKEGMEDAVNSGLFRSKQNVPAEFFPGSTLRMDKSFGTNPYFTPRFETASTYGDNFLAEVPKDVANWRNRYTRSDWSQIADRPIPINEGRLLQKDWWQGYKEVPKQEDGGIIKDDRGQWDHPGEVTEIGSNEITMKGVPYNVIGVSDTGDVKMMRPGKDYKFKGKKVTEYPMAKNGMRQEQKGLQNLDQLTNFTNYNKPQPGGWLNKYN
jgi:hypothetical protein